MTKENEYFTMSVMIIQLLLSRGANGNVMISMQITFESSPRTSRCSVTFTRTTDNGLPHGRVSSLCERCVYQEQSLKSGNFIESSSTWASKRGNKNSLGIKPQVRKPNRLRSLTSPDKGFNTVNYLKEVNWNRSTWRAKVTERRRLWRW